MTRSMLVAVFAVGLAFTAVPASAVVNCKTVGVPKGCVVRPVVVAPRVLAAVQPTSTVVSTALVFGANVSPRSGHRVSFASDDQGLSTVAVVSPVDKSLPGTKTLMENNRAGSIAQKLTSR